MKVVIIGSGNVAEALALAVANSSNTLVQIFARNPSRGRHIASLAKTEWSADRIADADAYLIAVSDSAIRDVASRIPFPQKALVAHTAGSGTLEMLPESIQNRAVLYPFMTFTAGRRIDFSSVPLFLEASCKEAMDKVKALAETMAENIFIADFNTRRQLHLAGVFASNFANDMFAASAEIVTKASLPFSVLSPIILETARKAAASEHPETVQTGPAVRGDVTTQKGHLELLAQNEPLKHIYEEISKDICRRKTSRKS